MPELVDARPVRAERAMHDHLMARLAALRKLYRPRVTDRLAR
jgi:hypothetical protein